MTITIEDLLKQVPIETEQIVNTTRKRFNTIIRQMLRQETGLRLSGGKNTEDEHQDGHSIRIFVEPGVPEELHNLKFDDSKRLAAILSPWLPALTSLSNSSNSIQHGLIDILPYEITEEDDFASIALSLSNVKKFSDRLIAVAESFRLIEELHAINEDIFGHYFWRVITKTQTTAHINLYWGVIGLVARAYDTSVQGLTVKVLAHELAHAFTHLGLDIDGHRWNDKDFMDATREVKEGLAQYYTKRIVARLRERIPEAEHAYETILPHQPAAYQIQEKWVKKDVSPEHIRLAMVKFRRFKSRTLDEFESFLEDAKRELG